jgi:serine/threonine-protein kinase SRK2
VLPFAKRGDDRGNNLIRLQQMFPRIVAAEFQQPLHVSPECQHLLTRMLTPDPALRITIGEIMQHSWCAASPST